MESKEERYEADEEYESSEAVENLNGRYRGKRLMESRGRKFWSDYGYLLITVVVVVLVFRVLLQLAWVPTGSMETTIPARTLLVSWRLPYLTGDPEPERGDIVTFWDEELGKILVKRVIGLPGETITFSDGYTYVNAEKLDEPYLPRQGNTNGNTDQDSFQVPEGCIFVMGDNRTGSWDSRYLAQPYIPMHDIKARVMIGISVFKENSWRGIHSIA